MSLGLDPVIFIHPLGLGQFVDLGSNDTREHFFRKTVGDLLA
jgi:hypothetical protein